MTAPSRSRLGNAARSGKRFIGIRLALSQLGRQVGHRAHPQQLALDVFVQLIFPPHRGDLLPAHLDLIQIELPQSAMIAIRVEIEEIASGKMDKTDNVLKNAPHTAESIISDNWNHSYSRE